MNFEKNTKSNILKKKKQKKNTLESLYALFEGKEKVLIVFKSGLFPLKSVQDTYVNILTPKQIIQRLSIALAQVKAGNTSENLVN